MSTFFVTDERMLKHRCEWDAHHIERPERLSRILSKLKSTGILDECTKLSSRHATIDELTTVHDEEYVRKVESTAGLTMLEQEDFSSQFEDIYVNESTWDAALLSAGCALELTAAVWREGRGANGFAAIRPPGHHASRDQGCGFCLFNNVVLSAKQLPESASKNEYENTLNVPLNRVGYGDFDYAALMHSIVLPVVGEWRPDIVLVSCGFDAAIGDPEGEMEVTPAGFAWMCGVLAAQEIPLVLLLEGGYFVESVAECAHSVLRALIERFRIDCKLEHPFRLSSFEQKFHRLDGKATIVSAELAAAVGSLPEINGLFN
ncbi:Hist-deacetyl domain-containing protein [Aphelenchoides fujianensis]|nr:Hist-deacetyl domain-containing protein [Aphelenchoides fujianensis]